MIYEQLYIGIDPGAHGGIAVLHANGSVLDVAPMPETPLEIFLHLQDVKSQAELVTALLENVGHGMPGQSSSATAKFARHCGHIEMALISLGIPTVTVTPNKWMRHFQLGRSSEYTKTEWKNRLKAKAQQIFPSLGRKVTLSTCDALLMAEYLRNTK